MKIQGIKLKKRSYKKYLKKIKTICVGKEIVNFSKTEENLNRVKTNIEWKRIRQQMRHDVTTLAVGKIGLDLQSAHDEVVFANMLAKEICGTF